jgi:hypothetical protein
VVASISGGKVSWKHSSICLSLSHVLSIPSHLSVATLQLNVVQVSTGELLESVAGVLKGGLDLGQLDISIEVVTDVAH